MRHLATAGAWWVLLTIAGLYWAMTTPLNPPGYALEAELIDDAFQFMTILAVPVFTLVVVFLGYSFLTFRASGKGDGPPEDGPPVRGHGPLTWGWLMVTSTLAIFVIINPGIVGMLELMHHGSHNPDVIVKVTGFRWAWMVEYPDYGITSSELVLPVGSMTKFEITATDVLHSFWVPAFRIKIDAVPGLVTTTHVTPTQVGTFEQDDSLRIQCAELCGLAHGMMRMPVRVVDQKEWDAWVMEKTAGK